jgi:nucleoside-diphosphate-sugar epimerase
MNVQIIGGSGFIGTNLIDKLKGKDEYKVSNIDKASSEAHPDITVSGDVRESDKVSQQLAANGWVVLLAAEHRDDVAPVSLYYDVNVKGTENVLKAMDEKGIQKIIFTSSVAVYGLDKENPSEDHVADPFNHYGKSKWQAEELLRAWYNRDPEKRSLVIIRPTVVFGPGNRGNVYNLLKQIASGKFLMIGRGNNKKSMAYVENITGFIKYCIDQHLQGYHVFNYADKPDLSMNELVVVAEGALSKKLPGIRIPYWLGYAGGLGFDLLSKVTGKKLPISAVRVKKFCATTQFNNQAVLKSTYHPDYTLAEGLSHTLAAIVQDHPA